MATQNNQRKTKYKSKGIDLMPYIYALLGLSSILLLYISYRMYITERHLISISVFALIAGAMYETKYITKDSRTILMTAAISFLLSFATFLPGKRERYYDFENHIQTWPYVFLVLFLFFTIVFNKEKVTPKLTEGTTLLQSIAIIYWVIDFGLLNTSNVFLISLLFFGLLFSVFSIVHTLTNLELTRTSRLILSIWSTIIFVLFAVENIIRTFQNQQIENTENIVSGIYIGLQYFLLGVSGVYILQSYIMLIAFLPGKNSFFNKQYFKELKELKSDHINRYSLQQIDISHSLFCIIFTGGIFYLNHQYKIVPKHIAIWIVFISFPVIINIYEALRKKNSQQN